MYEQYVARKIDKTQIANELGVSRATLYKLIEEYDASWKFLNIILFLSNHEQKPLLIYRAVGL